jgi:hypothetical protein
MIESERNTERPLWYEVSEIDGREREKVRERDRERERESEIKRERER